MALPTSTVDAWHTKFKAFYRGIVGAVVDIWPNTWAVTAKVLALLAREVDLRLAVLYRQVLVSTSDGDYVRRHAFEYGIASRAAGRASGDLVVTALGAGTIPEGIAFQRDDGALFLTNASAIATAGPVTLSVQADVAGLAGNTPDGATLTLISTSPVALSGGIGAVSGGLGGGTATEDVEDLRQRVLQRKRNPPQGGSASDWERWAREVPGVDRVFVDSFSNTDRRVWIAVTFEDRVNGIPNSGDVAAVQAHLEDPNLRPVTARVTVVPPTAVPVNIAATGVEPLTTQVEAAIKAELAAVFAERMLVARPNHPFVLPRAWLSEAISRAIGEDRHTLTAPATDLTFTTPGELPVLGNVTLT
ncbi:MAG: baseplate J/gp47 family protein [Bosea sp.]|uniref:baseplate J/gp47 family protein n=1 Tax=Bosea sp. (in: a-proteobacteria) TaxID=1871050 RepID=UPI001AD3ECFB|nr:baseplate J/gp47 family protein [Bosea sp. (in: a-proteobacteria)]MBN9453265.1 baseplate J/gp47 family protein [Bosea sp. (in: a-proteobacteria)]